MADDLTQCMVSNSRMAARAITRRYDAYLRPHGVTATQFSLLGAIRLAGGSTVSALAEARGFDRTTLTRNLDRLQKNGLIASSDAEKGNGRLCAVTAKGDELLEMLLPLWRQAQAEMKQRLSEEGFATSIKVLKRLAKV